MSAFERAPHYLLDTRLMMAWAKALAERGEIDKARHVAARLREFRNDQADGVLRALCGAGRAARRGRQVGAAGALPVRRRRAPLGYRDFS